MLFLFTLCSVPSIAQSTVLKRTHPLSLNTQISRTAPAVGTLDVVAIMVEFQPDTNRLTSGTGIFGENGMEGLPYLTREEKTFIDPLPHNQSYFEAHLEFAKNYFLKSSDNQLAINYQVLPQVYQLDRVMADYSPIGETFTLEKIALLMNDVWQKVEENGGFDASGLDPEQTAFVIFHAGVGRDVELTGTSLTITPFDLPSIFLDKQKLRGLLDDPGFDGFEINNGNFRVTNSMLIPRTQSRRGEDIQENEIVFPLSINGLLCASIGSYLGLPDLFNTTNGQPAIGRFGLMDGAGFFAYNGLLPPEPSAWEKVFLGWETPIKVTSDFANPISLAAASLNEANSIAQINLSDSEYFLIENRHRDPSLNDPENARVDITIRQKDGTEVIQSFSNTDEDFVFQQAGFDTLLTPGTIVDVSNFDWSLPGGIDIGADGKEDTEDDRHLNGGILIWHIDEQVIANNLLTDGVNGDELRRGVDLEEGDGAQDIGRDVGLIDNTPSFGFAYDFWWSGNDYRVITLNGTFDLNPNNIFGPNSYPDNDSNSGAKSFFELYDFSDNLPVASFRIREVSSENFGYEEILTTNTPSFFDIGFETSFTVRESDGWRSFFPLATSVYKAADHDFLIIPANTNLMIAKVDEPENPQFYPIFTRGSLLQPLVHDALYLATTAQIPSRKSRIVAYEWDENIADFTSVWRDSVIVDSDVNYGFLSSQNGNRIDYDFTPFSFNASNGQPLANNSGYSFQSEINGTNFVGINDGTVRFVGENLSDYQARYGERLFAGSITTDKGMLYYLFEDGIFTLVNPQDSEPFTTIFEEENAEWPAITNDATIFRVNSLESSLEAFNPNGALLNNFPIHSPEHIQFTGTPLIADITGDNRQDILVVGQDEYSVNIFAYETDGAPIEGFPLYVGASLGKNVQPIHPVLYNDVLYAVSHTNDLKGWRFLNFTSSQWPSTYGKNGLNKVSADIILSNQNDTDYGVLNNAETYNWPNPADEETHLRFQVSAQGSVEVTIVDFSGRVVYERIVSAKGGAPEELTIQTSDWGSGAYFAMIKATVNGQTDSKLVKIGVAH